MLRVYTSRIGFRTKGCGDIVDITGYAGEELKKSCMKDGSVCVFVSGSTAAVTTIEYEPGLIKDIPGFFERIIPSKKRYAHDDTWGDANGYAHIRASLQGPSLSVPFSGGELLLGRWQQIVFLEFDNRSRQRVVIFQFTGA